MTQNKDKVNRVTSWNSPSQVVEADYEQEGRTLNFNMLMSSSVIFLQEWACPVTQYPVSEGTHSAPLLCVGCWAVCPVHTSSKLAYMLSPAGRSCCKMPKVTKGLSQAKFCLGRCHCMSLTIHTEIVVRAGRRISLMFLLPPWGSSRLKKPDNSFPWRP